MKNRYLALLFIMIIPIAPAFADSGDCWFIFCWFESNDELTTEEIYIQSAQNGRERAISTVINQISELKENNKMILDAQELGMISGADRLIDASNDRANFLQKLIDEDNYIKNNPDEFLTQNDLVDRAMNYYKLKPDGTPCDDDRRWIEDKNNCMRQERASKIFFSWDLEWLRDHPELDTRRGA